MTIPSRWIACAAALPLLFVASGCGEETFDTADMQKQVAKTLKSTYGDVSVKCPDDISAKKGTKVTNIIPDFASAKWIGLAGEVADAPFLPICRSQIEMAYQVDDLKVAQNMPGFHWMTIYGDYLREVGYALKRVPIAWEVL